MLELLLSFVELLSKVVDGGYGLLALSSSASSFPDLSSRLTVCVWPCVFVRRRFRRLWSGLMLWLSRAVPWRSRCLLRLQLSRLLLLPDLLLMHFP